jgi:DNA replication protein DnaC
VLRALKLTGMLETLDARLAEARAGTLGHVDFLQTLCEDELARRDTAKIARRLRAAHLPSPATLESFDYNFNPKGPVAQIRDLARLEFIPAGESVCIYGPLLTGQLSSSGSSRPVGSVDLWKRRSPEYTGFPS